MCLFVVLTFSGTQAALAEAVAFSESDFGVQLSGDVNNWRKADSPPVIHAKYRNMFKGKLDRRYYCGVNIDCTNRPATNSSDKPNNQNQ